MDRAQVSQLLAGTNLDGKTRRAFEQIFDGLFLVLEGKEQASGSEQSRATASEPNSDADKASATASRSKRK